MSNDTVGYGTCACGQAGQLFETGKCAHCTIAELKEETLGLGQEIDEYRCALELAEAQNAKLKERVKELEDKLSEYARITQSIQCLMNYVHQMNVTTDTLKQQEMTVPERSGK